MGRPAIFLDRDGVIIENRSDYVRSWNDVVFLPGALEALARLGESNYLVIIITNQSAIGRGLLSPADAAAINERLAATIRDAGGRVDQVYLCPHTDEDRCGCRKPQPGMLFRAAVDLDVDLGRSLLVGDALSDIQAGRAAGVAATALVLTGRGRAQSGLPEATGLRPLQIFETLGDALAALVGNGEFSKNIGPE